MKLYADEDGAAPIRMLDAMVVSCLARVEVPAAIWRKQRMGELTIDYAATLVADFEADYFGTPDEPERFVVLGVNELVLGDAARRVAVHGLSAYDAVQLSTGILARHADPDCDRFACFDDGLRAAAATEGFQLLPRPSAADRAS